MKLLDRVLRCLGRLWLEDQTGNLGVDPLSNWQPVWLVLRWRAVRSPSSFFHKISWGISHHL
jgi:hypothetical protein